MPPRPRGGAPREVVRPPATANEEESRPARPPRGAPDVTVGRCDMLSSVCRLSAGAPGWWTDMVGARATGRRSTRQPVSWCRGGRFLRPGEVTGGFLPPMHRRVASCASLSGPAVYGDRKAAAKRPRPPLAATKHTCLTMSVCSSSADGFAAPPTRGTVHRPQQCIRMGLCLRLDRSKGAISGRDCPAGSPRSRDGPTPESKWSPPLRPAGVAVWHWFRYCLRGVRRKNRCRQPSSRFVPPWQGRRTGWPTLFFATAAVQSAAGHTTTQLWGLRGWKERVQPRCLLTAAGQAGVAARWSDTPTQRPTRGGWRCGCTSETEDAIQHKRHRPFKSKTDKSTAHGGECGGCGPPRYASVDAQKGELAGKTLPQWSTWALATAALWAAGKSAIGRCWRMAGAEAGGAAQPFWPVGQQAWHRGMSTNVVAVTADTLAELFLEFF